MLSRRLFAEIWELETGHHRGRPGRLGTPSAQSEVLARSALERIVRPNLVKGPMSRVSIRPLAVLLGLACASACGGDNAAPNPAPTLEHVVLTPDSVEVTYGQAIQFTVSGRWSNGDTTRPAVSYAATGGTISAAGLYTADTMVGHWQVIATGPDGLADSARIVLTLPPARHFTTNFPLTENPISQGGVWINGGAIGLDWNNVSTTPGLAIGHQGAIEFTDGTALLGGRWTPDQTVSATVHSVTPADSCYQEVELRLRSALHSHLATGYEITFKASPAFDAYLQIVRWNGVLGDFTYLSDNFGHEFGVTEGDSVSGTIVGDTIRAYKNGVLMAQVLDTVFQTGSPGMGFNLSGGVPGCLGTNGNYGFSAFSAADSLAP